MERPGLATWMKLPLRAQGPPVHSRRPFTDEPTSSRTRHALVEAGRAGIIRHGSACVILPIVEGHGEVTAVPILVRRIVAYYAPDVYADVGQAIRVKRTGLIQPGGVERTVELAARQTTPADGILIL